MKMIQHVGVVALGLLPLLTGCPGAMPESETLESEPVPAAEPQTSGGSSGTNGLSDVDYKVYESTLNKATAVALVDGSAGPTTITNPTVMAMLGTQSGRTVFTYAVTCALRAGTVVTFAGETYTGGGHLLNTGGWLGAALGPDARHDLLACMVAHVNPLGIHVPIVLSGYPVLDDGIDHSDFKVEEALWLVQDSGAKARIYYVWPLPTFEADCHTNPELALQQRVCGQNPVACSLIVRKDRATACTGSSLGAYMCDGHQVIKTALTTEGFNQLHTAFSVCPPL